MGDVASTGIRDAILCVTARSFQKPLFFCAALRGAFFRLLSD